MVLVDTSVWIRAFTKQAPYIRELDRLLSLDEAAGHELVYGELLIGDVGGRKKMLVSYERMHQVQMIFHGDVVAFVLNRGLHGLGVGWIDIHLLASAIAARLPLWTADPRFDAIAKEFGVSYKIPVG